MRKYKVYLFDFDGTLCNTLPALIYVFQESYAVYGIDVTEEECLQFSREPLPVSFERKGGDMTLFWDFVDYINFYLNGKKSVELSTPYHDTEELLKIMSKSDSFFGIVTSNNIPHVKDIFNCHELPLDDFDIFIGNQEASTPKPDPQSINVALERLNYQGDLSDVVYIGDSLNDCLAAKNAGVECYLLDRNNEYEGVPYPIIHSLLDLFK